MRYQLFVRSRGEAESLLKGCSIRKNCEVLILSKLKQPIPRWFEACHAPMVADMSENTLYHGSEAIDFLKSKTALGNFGTVENLD